jgi:hypothetical protein
MSKIYDPASPEVLALVADVIKEFHPALLGARVHVEVLTVTDDNGEHALMCGGYPALGVVRITTLKERAAGRGDAEIVIERDRYQDMTAAERRALIDHELYHLYVATDKHGTWEIDACGRPELRMRKHDFQVGWFHEIAQRHGAASAEVQQARSLAALHGQTYLGIAYKAPVPVDA